MITAGAGHDGHDIFHAAVQMSRMPMCLSDPNQPDDPIIFCNRAFEQLTGYPAAEIVGRNCRFLQGEHTDRAVVAAIGAALAAREDVHQEILNYRRDGTPYWNALFISPVVDTTGRLIYFFASQIDVTRRREAEAVLRQSQRMETLGGMASSMAHEFNNLMTIVLASLDRIQGEADRARLDRYISRAIWGAQRASRLTDQMLSFARRQFHDDRVIELNQAIREFDGIIDQMAGSKVSVSLHLCAEPLVVRLDPGQLELALLNLVRNAADAIGNSGRVSIETRARPFAGSGDTRRAGSGDTRRAGSGDTRRAGSGDTQGAEIAVIDQGPGIPPELVARVVEPFFTTKPPGRGTGLGLSMVSGFAEQSQGRLEIDTALGRGTAIRLVFPAVPG